MGFHPVIFCLCLTNDEALRIQKTVLNFLSSHLVFDSHLPPRISKNIILKNYHISYLDKIFIVSLYQSGNLAKNVSKILCHSYLLIIILPSFDVEKKLRIYFLRAKVFMETYIPSNSIVFLNLSLLFMGTTVQFSDYSSISNLRKNKEQNLNKNINSHKYCSYIITVFHLKNKVLSTSNHVIILNNSYKYCHMSIHHKGQDRLSDNYLSIHEKRFNLKKKTKLF
ncbi:hypothetical protein AGLY_009737 [Aphis glycines]|uniref:Uncharacterized protein n=1 Tax=Aphis glycines TaxID=307491 RepID=A0A6G0THJ5_APHGL|nr:hypothetical protein AGLY_009737 [Aphis glycines]